MNWGITIAVIWIVVGIILAAILLAICNEDGVSVDIYGRRDYTNEIGMSVTVILGWPFAVALSPFYLLFKGIYKLTEYILRK